MKVRDSIALVTGANQGIGQAFVETLLAAGAARIYAIDIHMDWLERKAAGESRLVPVKLDIRDEDSAGKTAKRCPDVNLLINNAAITQHTGLIRAASLDRARDIMDTNYFGTLHMCRAFAPVLKANGGGMIVNVLSIASLVHIPRVGPYSASKAAESSMTQGVRAELAGQGTKVLAVFAGPVDTAISSHRPPPKAPPSEITEATLQAIEEEAEEIYPDGVAKDVHAQLASDPKGLERRFAAQLPEG
ncbi:MAG: SDR family oxidoreductase [Alphaproteobacteria bacterium]|nr:SDR family oxidoreductase [Alphaproteobacteria bacterium]